MDIDRIVKERDILTVEQYTPLVIHYVLDDEQAEILNSSFVKIFRISQLAIEYLLFCKKYLDNTVVLLKKEMTRIKQVSGKIKFKRILNNQTNATHLIHSHRAHLQPHLLKYIPKVRPLTDNIF